MGECLERPRSAEEGSTEAGGQVGYPRGPLPPTPRLESSHLNSGTTGPLSMLLLSPSSLLIMAKLQ